MKLTPVRKIPNYAVIIRSIHERGKTQREALAELDRRGLWLTDKMKVQAGLASAWPANRMGDTDLKWLKKDGEKQ